MDTCDFCRVLDVTAAKMPSGNDGAGGKEVCVGAICGDDHEFLHRTCAGCHLANSCVPILCNFLRGF